MAMPENSDKKLFPINYIAKVCNVSRATILRMEDDGLFTPAYKDPESGYRYYSNYNVTQVMAVLRFQKLGLTKKEIREIRLSPEDLEKTLNKLKMNYQFLMREIEDLATMIESEDDIRIRSFRTLGGNFFKRNREMIYTPFNLKAFVLDTLEEFIEQKHVINPNLTMKAYIEDADFKTSIGQFDGKKHVCTCVIPILNAKPDSDCVYIEPRNALTLSCQCDYYKSEELFWRIWNDAKGKGLKPLMAVAMAGFPDILFTVDPLTNRRTFRLMLPTK